MKITFVGGGSLVWGSMLLTDLAMTSPLRGATVVLQDVDAAALDLMASMGRKISGEAGVGFRLEVSQNLTEAVRGADFVIDSVGIGGLEAMRPDLEIPARYDVMQPVGCNVGPGGINRALRHIPPYPSRLPDHGDRVSGRLADHSDESPDSAYPRRPSGPLDGSGHPDVVQRCPHA